MPNEPIDPANDQPTPPPWFKFGEKTTTKMRPVSLEQMGVTLYGQSAALMFGDLRLESVEGDETLSLVASAAIELPAGVLNDAEFRGYAVDVRGVCIKTAGCRGVVVVQVGGATQTQVFGYGEVPTNDWFGRFYSFEPRPSSNTEPPPPQLPPLTLNVLLSMQRRSSAEAMTLTIESIDITADRV